MITFDAIIVNGDEEGLIGFASPLRSCDSVAKQPRPGGRAQFAVSPPISRHLWCRAETGGRQGWVRSKRLDSRGAESVFRSAMFAYNLLTATCSFSNA